VGKGVLILRRQEGGWRDADQSIHDQADRHRIHHHLVRPVQARAGVLDHHDTPAVGFLHLLFEIVAGRIDFYFVPLLPAKGLIEEGQLAALAVSSSRRATALPDVPTTVEGGFPESEFNFWVGVLVPSKTATPIVERLHNEIKAALENPAVKERLARLGADPMPLTSREFDALIQKEIISNIDLVKAANIKVD